MCRATTLLLVNLDVVFWFMSASLLSIVTDQNQNLNQTVFTDTVNLIPQNESVLLPSSGENERSNYEIYIIYPTFFRININIHLYIFNIYLYELSSIM